MIAPRKMTEIEKAELLCATPKIFHDIIRAHFLWEDTTENAYAHQVEIAREERNAAKEENEKLKLLMTKQYQVDERAYRVMEAAKEILAKHFDNEKTEDVFLGELADLSQAYQCEEPCYSWEEVKEDIDAKMALDDLKKEFAEREAELEKECANLRDKLTAVREECKRLLGEAADSKWDLDP
jgi:hypothetical protein